MSQDQPNIAEILDTVKEFAQGVAERSSGAERYDALCAAFLMGVVQRELVLGEGQDVRQRIELGELTGQQGNLTELYRVFSNSVRDGDYDDKWDSALEFTFNQVIDKVRVTNPNHLEAEHRQDQSEP